jgi:hypothetical protein
MSAWLRKGWLDADGKVVAADRYVPDNVVVSFTDAHLVVKSHNLPNHPTAVFPDVNRSLDGNPNFIQERVTTMRFPLEPRVDPRHVAMKDGNNNDHALPMGPIAVAVNGVVFFNPLRPHPRRRRGVAARSLLWAPVATFAVPLSQVSCVCEVAVGRRRRRSLPADRFRQPRVSGVRALRVGRRVGEE